MKLYITVLFVALTGTFFITRAEAQNTQCQYPVRPLVNGQCDNSDPACPENIKTTGGACETAPTPKPIYEPITETPQTLEEFGK